MRTKRFMPSVLIVAAMVPVVYIAAPLFHLLKGSSWTSVCALLQDPTFIASFSTSVAAACVTTIASVVFGLPTAFILSTRDFFGKRIIEGILLLPLVLPPVVGGVGLLSSFGPDTMVGGWFSGHGMPLSNSVIGVILAQFYIISPFIILSARAGFDEVPMELLEATTLLGGGMWTLFWDIYVPLSKSAIWSGIALTFARAVGEFGATMIMAYHPYTLPVDIWVQFTSGGLPSIVPMAAVIVGLIVVVAAAGSAIQKLITRKSAD